MSGGGAKNRTEVGTRRRHVAVKEEMGSKEFLSDGGGNEEMEKMDKYVIKKNVISGFWLLSKLIQNMLVSSSCISISVNTFML